MKPVGIYANRLFVDRSKGKIKFKGKDGKFLVDIHNIIVTEMERRKMNHKTPLTEEVKVKAPQNTEFIIHDHDAKRAGKHQDLRIKIANNKWASFAVKKGVPKDPGVRVLAVRTHDHTDKEALMVGEIPEGYGAGKLSVFDKGKCKIVKFASAHMVLDLKGRKIKGIYHMINVGLAQGKHVYKKQKFMLFKSKLKLEDK